MAERGTFGALKCGTPVVQSVKRFKKTAELT